MDDQGKGTPRPVHPSDAAANDWLEDIDEGELNDWSEEVGPATGKDDLAGVLQQIGAMTKALSSLPPAARPSAPVPPSKVIPSSTARVIPKGRSPAAPARTASPSSSGPSPSTPAPAAPGLTPEMLTQLEDLRRELRDEREKRVRLERELEEARSAAPVVVEEPTPSARPRDRSYADDASVPEPIRKLRQEVAKARAELELAREQEGSVGTPVVTGTPFMAVPIGFLGFDGFTVLSKSCFAVGRGEALHRLLGSFLSQWRHWPYPPIAQVTPKGLVISLPRDKQRRSIRILPTGAILLQMGPQYLEYVRSLPPVVSYRDRQGD